ncbi:MAG: hypothetical protein RLZ12_311 [Bacillota bacterium]
MAWVIDRTIFTIAGFNIYWYAVIMLLAIVAGAAILLRNASQKNIDINGLLDVVIVGVIAGIIGARLYDVFLRFSYYQHNCLEILNVRGGGLAIHGALFAGIGGGLLMAYYRKLPLRTFLDAAAPGLLLAQSIGRWGNFINQEAYGWAINETYFSWVPHWFKEQMYIKGAYHHPLFLYEGLWNLMGFIISLSLPKKWLKPGNLFFCYVIWYSIGRFYIEGLRAHDAVALETPGWLVSLLGQLWAPGVSSGVTVYFAQLVSFLLIFAALVAVLVNRRSTV